MNPEKTIPAFQWNPAAAAPPGGAVVDLAPGAQGGLWAASPSGLFYRSAAGGWRPQLAGVPLVRVDALAAAGRVLLAAGAPTGLARSADNGAQWQEAWVEQTRQPVVCLALAPNYGASGAALAGTYGAGILRTTDGGRYWQLVNFGLRDFHILALAVAPHWDRWEPAFAGTADGIYESPNGGRAWRRVTGVPDGAVILALAVAPDYENSGLVIAGTEAHGLWRSTDGGRSWGRVENLPFGQAGSPDPINCLAFTPSGIMLAGAAEGIWRSTDGGETWTRAARLPAPALSLRAANGQVYAGLAQHGLWFSSDDGASWQADQRLAARRFSWLAAAQTGEWIAGGPQEGLWTVGAPGWMPMETLPDAGPWLGLAGGTSGLLAATETQLWQAPAARGPWQVVLDLAAPPTALTTAGAHAWVGAHEGNLWRSVDGGKTWQALAPPFGGNSVAALAAAPDYEQSRVLLAVTADPARRTLRLWHGAAGGEQWQLWWEERTDWFGAHLIPAGPGGEASTLAWGLTALTRTPDGWQRAEIAERAEPLTAAVLLPGGKGRLAAAGTQLFWSADGLAWQTTADPWDGSACIALAAAGDQAAALGSDGRLFTSPLPGG